MAIVKTHGKGQIIMPKDIHDKLGIKPGTNIWIDLVDDHVEIRSLPDDPIEFLTGFLKNHPGSLAQELLDERKKDNRIDETNSLWLSGHPFSISLILPDSNLIWKAAEIKAEYSISYTACFAAATAQRYEAIVLTGDPELKKTESLVQVDWL